MFLKMSRALRREEEGSTLVSVLIIMLVLTIGGLVIANAVINTSGIVMTTRDSAESRAAADAGLADVSAMLQRGERDCTPGNPAPAPVASATSLPVKYSVAISCAIGANGRTELTLVSTGLGSDGATTKTSATYGPGLGGALTTMGVVPVQGALSLTGTNSKTNGNVLVNEGDFSCANNAAVAESVVARDGSVQISNSCTVTNSIISSTAVKLDNGAKVGGDVYALGKVTHASDILHTLGSNPPMFAIDLNVIVEGNVYVDGNVTLTAGHIKGSLTASGNVSISPAARVNGGIHAGGTITVNGSTTITPQRSVATDGGVAPSIPTPWQMGAKSFEWVDAPYTPPTSGQPAAITTCPPADPVSTIQALSNRTSPQVVDWRNCTGLINFFGTPIKLKSDLTIYVGGSIDMTGVKVSSTDGNPHRFNVIMPSQNKGNPISPATCGSVGSPTLMALNNVEMVPGGAGQVLISGIVYSPCKINVGGAKWNGLAYSQHVQSFEGSNITYRDVSLPNGQKLRQPLGPIIEMKDVG